MLVSSVLKTKGASVITVDPDQVIWSVLRRYQRHGVGALVVTDDDGKLIGMLSERDLVNGLAAKGKDFLDLRVADVMSTRIPTCEPSDTITNVMAVMTDRRTRHLPVLDRGRLCGLISIGDVVKARLGDVELENQILRDLARSHR